MGSRIRQQHLDATRAQKETNQAVFTKWTLNHFDLKWLAIVVGHIFEIT
jgi:hypothetical protein